MKSKKNLLLIIVAFTWFSQAQDIHIDNDDKATRTKITTISGTSQAENKTLDLIKRDLNGVNYEMEKLRRQQYQPNNFDKKHQNDFLFNPAITEFNYILDTMTKMKDFIKISSLQQDFLNELIFEQEITIYVLKEMSLASEELVQADHREEIYRLRSDVMSQIVRNNKLIKRELRAPFGRLHTMSLPDILNELKP